MADDQKKDTGNIERIALQLFAERSARTLGRGVEQVARQAFKDAEAFVAVAAAYRAGELVAVKDENILADVYAPKLKRTHPINLVSREWGDLNRVKKIAQELQANPTLETYEPMDWDKPTTALARDILPQYANN